MQDIFNTSFASKTTAEAALNAYGFDESSLPQPTLYTRVTSFIGDEMIGYRQHVAQRQLSRNEITSTSEVRHRTPVQKYRIKFGNPFPGVDKDIAHHSGELIYLFDCFHEALQKADEEEARRVPSKGEQIGTNAGLVDLVQRHWLTFITNDTPITAEEESVCRIYTRERRVREQVFSTYLEDSGLRRRYEVLEQDEHGLKTAMERITQTDFRGTLAN